MSTLQLIIPYKPHPGQQEFHLNPARFKAVAPGRRWGKTTAGANETIRNIAETEPTSIGFVVAPSYVSTSLGKCWNTILAYCPKELITEIHRTPGNQYIRFIGNRYAYFRSAETPDSCKGESLSWVWFDEPGEMKEQIWDYAILPSLIDKHGKAVFTGTPKGHNWYQRIFALGQDRQQTEYWSRGGSSYENSKEQGGYLDAIEIDKIAATMSERARMQEIEGLFIPDVGSTFRGVDRLIEGNFEEPQTGKSYVMGADIAKTTDYTVLTVMDDNGHVCGWERFSQLDWVFITKRIVNLARTYNARILIDASGVGNPVLDMLNREQVRVEGYKFTEASKKDLIENLSIAMDNKAISYPNIPELVNELKLFGYTQTPAGTVHYGAPEGYHDDCVISLALAAWLVKKPQANISFM